jgi:LPXTG-site transpeptidase (sortase) family protein
MTPLVASLVFVGLFACAVAAGRAMGIPLPSLAFDLSQAQAPMSPSQPTRISIPSLGVRADVVTVGQGPDGAIAAPEPDAAGWFEFGPTPGEAGTAVIVGHVDTDSRPAVFAELRDIKVGKFIEVTRADRRTATFQVDSVEVFPKSSFPADRILTRDDEARLALVTCGGDWVGGDVGYADNVIVFAHLV